MTNNNNKELLKILLGAAWLDGTVQLEERQYLQRVATEQGLADEPEIQSLLTSAEPISSTQCYLWMEDYLGTHPTEEDYQRLLSAISALVYSDGNIDAEEAKLLTQLQNIAPANPSSHSVLEKMLKTIQKLYRRSLQSI